MNNNTYMPRRMLNFLQYLTQNKRRGQNRNDTRNVSQFKLLNSRFSRDVLLTLESAFQVDRTAQHLGSELLVQGEAADLETGKTVPICRCQRRRSARSQRRSEPSTAGFPARCVSLKRSNAVKCLSTRGWRQVRPSLLVQSPVRRRGENVSVCKV